MVSARPGSPYKSATAHNHQQGVIAAVERDFIFKSTLPHDGVAGTLVGRVWRPDMEGPSVVVIRRDGVHDISREFPTMRDLCETPDPSAAARAAAGEHLSTLEALLGNTMDDVHDRSQPHLLAPIDLQAVKATGVTFAVSLLERVIEEAARGVPERATAARAEVEAALGGAIDGVKPGSPAAMELKRLLQSKGLWSQYLEVGLGADAEVFTKAQPMSAVGTGAAVGILANSKWNNPEPEIVLVINSGGEIVGATLGNDVNLRDFEGRSALLLGKAKDNNASAALGPFIRLFDATFSLDDVRVAKVKLTVEGRDGFVIEASSEMARISRDPADLVKEVMGAHHQYPDGAVLYMGTMFAPTKDREGTAQGFTHHAGDFVMIASQKLGTLVNTVTTCDRAPPWTFGTAALMRNLAKRKLI